ncbi:MAG TPA: lipoate--protein ligase family protein [Gemmatimonadaceae bacterium]|nr:lipoate--protein ligase family protein [Gemmatimonadaceae bacterium]
MSTPCWRLVVTPPAPGAENMALDEALMERAGATGEWVMRVYSWLAPTVSLGRNQAARGRYDVARIGELGYGIVRRPTGGRAILHAREITYSVTAPVVDAGDLMPSYFRINELLVDALRALGVEAEVAAPTERSTAPSMAPCFDHPSAGELTFGGRKLAGSAQWRSNGALLQHGSILIADDQTELASLTIGGGLSIPAPATLDEALGWTPQVRDVSEALGDAIASLEGTPPSELEIDGDLRARTTALVVRYTDDQWTWRR